MRMLIIPTPAVLLIRLHWRGVLLQTFMFHTSLVWTWSNLGCVIHLSIHFWYKSARLQGITTKCKPVVKSHEHKMQGEFSDKKATRWWSGTKRLLDRRRSTSTSDLNRTTVFVNQGAMDLLIYYNWPKILWGFWRNLISSMPGQDCGHIPNVTPGHHMAPCTNTFTHSFTHRGIYHSQVGSFRGNWEVLRKSTWTQAQKTPSQGFQGWTQ